MNVLKWDEVAKILCDLPVSGSASTIEEYRKRYIRVLPNSVSLTYALQPDGFVVWTLKNTKRARGWEIKMLNRLAKKFGGDFFNITTHVDTGDIHKILYRVGEKRVQR